MQKVHELKLADYPRRVNFCNWFLQQCRNANFLNRLYIGDEASFSMNGDINTRNMHYYAQKGNNPNFIYETPESRQKVTVWIGLCGDGTVLGPYFSKEMCQE